MATIQEVAEKFDVTPDQVKQLKEGMTTTWDMIGHDCYEFLSSYGSETEMIAEMTIDAGRLEKCSRIGGMKVDWRWLDRKGLNTIALGEATWDARY